ncbi:hypothetical protein P0082_01190 [Candidatus Haliotispira prima]|uniref:Uncharacterized protein n=1 Tax=Candidatus Haliotispira prima TaxID=3034016 RepID=A0ABY8ML19_9SPIO|nr:hypothetical protein P0082_01190 [Candidatus Haliotispira prima]
MSRNGNKNEDSNGDFSIGHRATLESWQKAKEALARMKAETNKNPNSNDDRNSK